MKETGLAPEQVVQIIRELRDSRVTMLKYRGLVLEMGPIVEKKGQWTSYEPSFKGFNPDPAQPAAFSSTPSTPVGPAVEQKEDDRLELLMLEDPQEYERLLDLKELENADTLDQ